jgi:hypothetical protein
MKAKAPLPGGELSSCVEKSSEEEILEYLGCSSYLRVDLNEIAQNIDIIRSKCSPRTGEESQ